VKTFVALCLLAGVATAEPRKPAVNSGTVEVAPNGHAITHVAIDNPLGEVHVIGYAGKTLKIEPRKQAPDDESMDRLRVSLVSNPDGTVRITSAVDGDRESKPLPRSAVRIDLVIHAPRDAKIDASVSAGKLTMENMDAGGELDTASGPISVTNVQGEVLTHSVSGLTQLAQVFGSVDAQSLAADVELDSVTGDRLVASAGKGKISGRRVRSRDIELTTTDGKIVLEAEASLRGHLVVSSLHGDVDVRLRRHGTVIVRARGNRVDLGSAVVTKADGWMTTRFGQVDPTGASIELRSRYGSVLFSILE
jgi:hypothetical protein